MILHKKLCFLSVNLYLPLCHAVYLAHAVLPGGRDNSVRAVIIQLHCTEKQNGTLNQLLVFPYSMLTQNTFLRDMCSISLPVSSTCLLPTTVLRYREMGLYLTANNTLCGCYMAEPAPEEQSGLSYVCAKLSTERLIPAGT